MHRSWMSMFSVRFFSAGLLVASLFFPCQSFAQLSSASVNGTIRDQKGAVIPGATVVLHNVDTSVDHQVVSNGSGAYAILNLSPGHYTLEAKASGFDPERIAAFVLAVDQVATFDFSLAVGSTVETVNVEAAAAQLDVSSANLGTVIETKQTEVRASMTRPRQRTATNTR